MKTPKVKELDAESPEAIVSSLSYHGAFLKKHVVKTFQKFPVGILGEEIPASFCGQPRAADLIACARGHLYMIVECKKVAPPKRWIFIRDMDDHYRVARMYPWEVGTTFSINSKRPFPQTPVCSDGYQYDPEAQARGGVTKRAESQSIYDAATQLCGASLGFVERRISEINAGVRPSKRPAERYVPLLVTNAPLFYINVADVEMNTTTGELTSVPEIFPVPHVVFNHPFAAQRGDFRERSQTEDWKLRYQESIYVLNVNSLGDFLAEDHLKVLAEAQDEPRRHEAG